jgi:hypothetical protein
MTDPTTTPQFKLLAPDGTCIATGSMSAISERILDSTSRRAAQQLVADAAQAGETLNDLRLERRKIFDDTLRLAHDKLSALVKRMDTFEAQEREQQRQDAEQEQREIQQMLDGLPDPDDPTDEQGDLSALGPTNKEKYTAGEDDQGDLPEELEAEAPTNTGTYFDPDDPDDPDPDDPDFDTPRDPPSVSLNADALHRR